MRFTSFLISLLSIGLLGGSNLSFISSLKKANYEPSKENSVRHEVATAVYPDPSSVELTSEDLAVNITSSTTTECSQAYQVAFSSSITTFSNKEKNVYITITDSSFTKETDYEALGDEATLPEFEAKVYSIQNVASTQGNVVIPRYLQYTTRFKMHVTGFYKNEVVDSYSNIKTILVHSDLESVPENTFVGVPDTVTINCMDSAPKEGWSENWTDAKNITYGYVPTETEVTALDTTKRAATQTPGTGKDFLIGYYGEGKYDLPLVITYNAKKSDGSIENRYQKLTLSSANSIYDGVGEGLGSSKNSKYIDINLGSGESIESDSIYFCNIYEYTRNSDQKIIPDFDKPSHHVKAIVSYSETYDLSDFITLKQGRASSYSGYTQVDLVIDKTPGIYKKLRESVYNNNKADIDSGVLTIRYRLTSLASGSYRLQHKENGTSQISTIKVDTPVDYFLLSKDKGNEVGFILKNSYKDEIKNIDYSFGGFSSIESMDFIGMYVTVDLFKYSTGAIVTKSSVSYRFGIVPMITNPTLSSYTDINAMMIIAIASYLVLFALGDLAYYFYKKRKFRNDEFRRLKPKQFIKHSLTNGFGFGLILLSILYIVARFAIMDTSVVAYNPLDVYVIVFTVAGAIFLGVAIKNAVVAIRDNKERKRAIKLHLGNDVVDDGTGTK